MHETAVGHVDPVVPVLLGLTLIFIAAKLGAIIAEKLGQPSVLGELGAGIVVGNLTLANIPYLEFLKHDHSLEIFAGIGVIILLFEVGLETSVKEMVAVGFKSLVVALVGVVLPFVFGYLAAGWIMPELAEINRIFMGAILTATSVGITARVFKDLNFLSASEAKIVLGAAVIDDILGLIILAVVSGIAVTGHVELGTIGLISGKAIGFVIACLVIGILLAKKTFKLISVFKLPGMMLIASLVICFIFAYFANQVGLATIVGAFCAGLVLEDVHFKEFSVFEKDKTIEDYIHPISMFFVPIFFVSTGMQVDLSVFADTSIVTAALIISVIAIAGKLVCGWSFTSKESVNRAIIGAGMIPRGEVGLIFATVGKGIGVVDDKLYAITVIMVILTTLVSPPVLDALIKISRKES